MVSLILLCTSRVPCSMHHPEDNSVSRRAPLGAALKDVMPCETRDILPLKHARYTNDAKRRLHM